MRTIVQLFLLNLILVFGYKTFSSMDSSLLSSDTTVQTVLDKTTWEQRLDVLFLLCFTLYFMGSVQQNTVEYEDDSDEEYVCDECDSISERLYDLDEYIDKIKEEIEEEIEELKDKINDIESILDNEEE